MYYEILTQYTSNTSIDVFDVYCVNILKGKGHPRIRHEGPEGEQTYNTTLSLTLAQNGVGGQRHDPAALPPRKTQCLLYKRLSGLQDRSRCVRKISTPHHWHSIPGPSSP